jgi:CPA1 family monovalent cation:H+ antiporter
MSQLFLAAQEVEHAAEGVSNVISSTAITVALLAIAVVVAVVVRRIKFPYTVALVLVGLLLAGFPAIDLNLPSELILGVLVPPLIFEATMHLPWSRLKADLPSILSFAVGGTLIGTAMVAWLTVTFIPSISWPAAIAFGALASATDPVAVIAFFRSLGVSKRLATFVEGESLLNDGVAIVIFNLALLAAGGATLTVGSALLEFVKVAAGGLLIGAILGYVVSNLVLKNIDDAMIETTTTVALAFGSYLIAEEFGALIGNHDLHLSGILAVVAAGMMVGNLGFRNTSPTTRLTLENFWEFLSFMVNSLVFLLLGLRIHISDMIDKAGPVLLAVLAILVSRAVIIYAVSFFHNRIESTRFIPVNFQHVMYWGGLRGAVSLALALTLPAIAAFEGEVATTLQEMTFGVVLFTLIVQGTTISRLINRLGLAHKQDSLISQEKHQANLFAKRAARRELERLRTEGVLFPEVWAPLDELYEEVMADSRKELDSHFQAHPELETAMFLQARADAISAERSAIAEAALRGIVSADTAEHLSSELAYRLAALDLISEKYNDGEGSP